MRHEFKCDISRYLCALPGHAPRSLAALIDFNIRNGSTVLPHVGQEIFLRAEATGGDPAGGLPFPGAACSGPVLTAPALAFEQRRRR